MSLFVSATSADADAVRAASAALVIFGRRLGALIATLRDPRTRDEQAGTRGRAYLSYWLTVDSVWLAGGLLAGRFGHIITGAAHTARPQRRGRAVWLSHRIRRWHLWSGPSGAVVPWASGNWLPWPTSVTRVSGRQSRNEAGGADRAQAYRCPCSAVPQVS